MVVDALAEEHRVRQYVRMSVRTNLLLPEDLVESLAALRESIGEVTHAMQQQLGERPFGHGGGWDAQRMDWYLANLQRHRLQFELLDGQPVAQLATLQETERLAYLEMRQFLDGRSAADLMADVRFLAKRQRLL